MVVATAVVGIVLILAGGSAVSGLAVSAMRNGADYACVFDSMYATDLGAGHNPESVIAEGAWSLIPLGLECILIATDTGTRDRIDPSQLPTALIVGGALFGSVAVFMASRTRLTDVAEVSAYVPWRARSNEPEDPPA
ncbi:hypothetical protein [Microbacterium timonense]|uniref:hypothetical protein n=1 Tax=Microbacterium timonense TaxID=2086576 RepID=UPI000D0E434D|nr:hypothetical protein [Microbacterium timonense]